MKKSAGPWRAKLAPSNFLTLLPGRAPPRAMQFKGISSMPFTRPLSTRAFRRGPGFRRPLIRDRVLGVVDVDQIFAGCSMKARSTHASIPVPRRFAADARFAPRPLRERRPYESSFNRRPKRTVRPNAGCAAGIPPMCPSMGGPARRVDRAFARLTPARNETNARLSPLTVDIAIWGGIRARFAWPPEGPRRQATCLHRLPPNSQFQSDPANESTAQKWPSTPQNGVPLGHVRAGCCRCTRSGQGRTDSAQHVEAGV